MVRTSNVGDYDTSISLNQDLTFSYAEQRFAEVNVKFEAIHKKILGLINADGYYTNTALLLSEQCEHSIKCAAFKDETKANFKARNEFTGSILKQLDDAYAYLELNNNVHGAFSGLRRVDLPEYPVVALREALMNSAVHRDYSSPSSTLINLYTDRVEFVSMGSLSHNLTIDDVMNGISHSRNNKLAHVFYQLELIEGFGTGIQRIIGGYKDFSIKPTFTPSPSSFVVVLPNRHYNADVNNITAPTPPGVVRQAPPKATHTVIQPTPEPARDNTKCIICGQTLRSQTEKVCSFCMRNEDLLYRVARDYIEEHPSATPPQIFENTGVPTKKIIQFLREERLSLSKAESGFLLCMNCHKPIGTGKLCDACKKDFRTIAKKMNVNPQELADERRPLSNMQVYSAQKNRRH